MADNPVKFSDLFDPLGDGTQQLLDFTKAIQGLSRNYTQFSKNLDEQGQKVVAGIAALKTQAAAFAEQGRGLNLLTEQGKAGLAALGAEAGRVAQEYQRLKQAEAGIAATRRTTTEATAGLTTELKKQQQAFKEAYAANNTEGIRTAAAEILKLKTQAEDFNRALRGANSIYTAAAGSYRAMENEARLLGGQLKALEGSVGGNADEVRDLQKRLGDVNAALISFGRGVNDGHANVGRYAEGIIEAVGALEKQRKALLADAEALRTQAGATNVSREQQDKLQQEIRQTEAELTKVNGQLRAYGVETKQAHAGTSALSEGAASLVQSLTGAYVGIQGLATALQQVFEANVKYSDSVADVAKTTGLTIEQTNALADSLKQLDTRTSLQGLLDIAAVGGQLGVAAGDIENFTKAIDISVQALGNDFSGGAEEIATALGKINTVFGKQLSGDLSANLLHIGSALNQLGAVGAATAPQLAEVALRTGAVAANAGLGLDKVLSYATVLEEVGFSAEQSGTSLNRLFSTLSTRTKASFDIAKLGDANLTLKEFKRLVNTDFEAAIQAFLKGLNAGGTTTTRFNALLGTLKLSSGEAKNVITSLAKNIDTYRERLAVANQELQTGNSVAAEAAIKNDTLGGSYEKLKNSISNFFTNGALGDFLKDAIDLQRERFDELATGFHKLGEAFDYLRQKAGLAKAVQRDGLADQFAATKSLYDQATAAQKLLDRYTALNGVTNKTSAQQAEQSNIVRQLQASIAAGVAVVDKDTKAVTLNTQAVQESIDKKKQAFENQKQSLVDQLSLADATVAGVEADIDRLQQVASKAQLDLSAFGLDKESIERVKVAAIARQEAAAAGFTTSGRSLIPEAQIQAATQLTSAEKSLITAEKELKTQQAQRAQIAANLAAISKLDASATAANTKATDDDVEADKKKKKSVADVAKEEYELQRLRLQARIANLDRQADNPANSQEIRTLAVKRGVEARIQLAKLEQVELGREAAQTNKEKINGEEATAAARRRLVETFHEQEEKAERDGNTKLITLRISLLNHLAELDKLGIEEEIAAAEKVRDDVNKTYDERQKAARQAAHAQIELAALVRDTEIRNAQGALDKIELANAKYEQARKKASASVKVYDSQKDIDEQEASYARLLLATEALHNKQLISDKEYQRQVRDLNRQQEEEAIASLEAEYGETAEVLRRKAALRKKEGAEEIADEKKLAALRQEIIAKSIEFAYQATASYFQAKGNFIDAEIQRENDSYETQLAAAGDNAALKLQIQKKYEKQLAKLNYEKAKAERDQAAITVAIQTAVAIAKAIADYGLPYGLIPAAIALAIGAVEEAVILTKPLPAYFKGRTGGPAELAQLGERGPELVGQEKTGYRLVSKPSIGYLAAGDQVYTAPETRRILAENELAEGRLFQRRQAADMETQTARLRVVSEGQPYTRAVAEARAAATRDTDRLVRAIKSQEQLRVSEGELQRWKKSGDTWQQHKNRRYHFGQ